MMQRPSSVLTAGDVLGDCEILALLGRGGMGEVYLARDRRLGRKVAVKVLPASFASDVSRLTRFEREARSASALNHPNICTIHSLGELPDGRRFIVMEQVDSTTLRALHRDPVDLRRIVDIGRQLAEALATAHESGIVHRDVKPENVMVRADGLVKILDFGLAKILPDSAMAPGESTQSGDGSLTGGIVGTVQYMSPEQARGLPTDARTDVWALGVVLYELVAGHPPFGGRTTSDIVANVLHAEPPPLGRFAHDCPPELQRIVSKCLRKDRAQRYHSMRDVALDLEALRDALRETSTPAVGAPGDAATLRSEQPFTPPSSGAPPDIRHSRRSVVTASVIGVLLVAAGGIAWFVYRAKTPETIPARGTRQLPFKRLTFDAGFQTDVSFSPDGRFIAYASDRSGNFDVWVQPVEGGDPVQITREAAQDVEPRWSPDGKSIVFRSERNGGGIFLMPALGGHARQISNFGRHPSWLGPSEILFMVGNVDAGLATTAQLFVASVNGDGPHEVLHDFLAGGGLYWAAGHPDGRISVFGEHRALGTGFFTISRDGRSITTSRIPASFPIHPRFLESTPTRFQWNRSGTAVYLEASVDGIQNLWHVTIEPRSLEWLNLERLTTGPGRDVGASLSSDGRRLAYTTSTEQTRVYMQSFSTDGRSVVGSPVAVTEAGGEVFGSSISHDGRRLAYVLRRAGSERFELRIAHLDTGEHELLDEDVHGSVNLGWAPDDTAVLHQLVDSPQDQPSRFHARLMRHEPGGRETVLFNREEMAFLASDGAIGTPDLIGSVYHFSGGPSEIGVWSVTDGASTKPSRLLFVDPAANLWEARYVPGRRWISFVRQPLDDAQRLDLMIGPAAGSPPSGWTRVAPDHSWPDKPRWSADGQLLYFISRGSKAYFNLWAVTFDPVRGVPIGAPFAITSYDSPTLFMSPHVEKTGMDVASGRVTLTMTSTTGSIWMLDDVEPAQPQAAAQR